MPLVNTPEQMRERLGFIEQQARANGGWDRRTIEERDRLQAELAKIEPTADQSGAATEMVEPAPAIDVSGRTDEQLRVLEKAGRDGWREAVDLIRQDASIEEVLLSGGDPLSLSNGKLAELTGALADIPHLRRLRIHSRLPIVVPERVDDGLMGWLSTLPWPVTLVVHANHANEFDGTVDAALGRLRAAGVHLLNQAVLLRGVNDSVDALAALSERGFRAGVLPYYLHQLDRVAGVAHFEVDDAHARALHAGLAARLSGYLVPRLVREIPGDTGKRPL